MDKRLCEKIIQHFDFKTMEVLAEYITYRTSVVHSRMETCGTEEIKAHQGEIRELQALSKIRDWAVNVLDRG
jgi:ribosomal protein S18